MACRRRQTAGINMQSINRRQILGMAGLAFLGSAVPVAAQESGKLPTLQFFNIKDFGATGDGVTLDTVAINKAISACNAAGGGIVYLPPGTYLSGTVILKSNVTFYLEAGATLLGSKNISDYTAQPQTQSPGSGNSTYEVDVRDAGAYHLVFARDSENIRVTGSGKIDGQGPAYWIPNEQSQTPPGNKDSWTGHWKPMRPRPSPMLEFYNCKNLHIEDIRIENSPGWTLRPIHCDNVFIQGISIKNPSYGPNTDGMDPTCCHNVFISNCYIDAGDDAICLKSENPYGEELRTSKNITITNCVLTTNCNGLKFGTATHGGFENIVFSNSVIFNEDGPAHSRVIAGIALEMVDGGWHEGIVISNIRMQRVRTPIFIRRANRTPRPDGTPGTLRGVMIENVYATGSLQTSSIAGLPGFDVEDVTLSNIRIDSEEEGKADWVDRKIPEREKNYPESSGFGRLPAYGFYCRHVTGLRLRNVEVRPGTKEERPAIFCDDVKDVEISGLRCQPIVGTQPVVMLAQTKQALVRDCSAPPGTKTFLEVQGDQTGAVVVMNNDLSGAEKSISTGADVPQKAVLTSGNLEA
jgi:polygalacturonase